MCNATPQWLHLRHQSHQRSPHTPPQACLFLPVCRVACHPDSGDRQYIESMHAYFRAHQPPMLRVSQALPFRASVYAIAPTEWDAHTSKIRWRRYCITGVARVATVDGPASFVYFCNCCTDSQVGLSLVQMFHDKPESTSGLQSARCLHARALQHMLGPEAAGPNEAVSRGMVHRMGGSTTLSKTLAT